MNIQRQVSSNRSVLYYTFKFYLKRKKILNFNSVPRRNGPNTVQSGKHIAKFFWGAYCLHLQDVSCEYTNTRIFTHLIFSLVLQNKLQSTFLRKTPTNALRYVNTILFTPLHCYMLQRSGSTDTFREQGQQNACSEVNIRLNSSFLYVTWQLSYFMFNDLFSRKSCRHWYKVEK